jgi:hypothetical protein
VGMSIGDASTLTKVSDKPEQARGRTPVQEDLEVLYLSPSGHSIGMSERAEVVPGSSGGTRAYNQPVNRSPVVASRVQEDSIAAWLDRSGYG